MPQHRPPIRRPWSPTPVIQGSLVTHAAAFGALIAAPGHLPEIAGLLGANHALLACGMRPRSAMLGPNLVRLPPGAAGQVSAVALTFDDGPDPEVTPRVLDLLDRHGAKASFFVIGRAAARHPHILRDIAARGHQVGNHTHSHPLSFGCWTPRAMQRELGLAQAAIADACGQYPQFFRAPAGIRNPLLDPVLADMGLHLVSWTRRGLDTMPSSPDRVLRRLLRGLQARDILLLHDRSTRWGGGILAMLPRLLEDLRQRGLTAVALPPAVPGAVAAGAASGATCPG